MANSAFDETDETDETAAAKPPLSTHRAFPAIVALWFAMLLGLGNLVLPAALFERPLAAAGLASLVPLGLAGRGLIAVAAALVGAWTGLAIARRVATAPARPPAAAASPRRPFRVRDELGADGPGEDQPQPTTRRRARTIVAGESPANALPPAPDEGPAEAWPGEDPWPETAAPEDDDEVIDREPFESLPRHDGGAPEADGETMHDPESGASASLAASPADPEIAEPAPEEPGREAGPFGGDWTTLPLEQLGLVHLLERLGASLERRHQRLARSAPADMPAPPGIDPAPADEAAQAMAAYFGRSFAPAGDAEQSTGDPLASFSLPTRDPAARPSASPDAESDDSDGDSFGSLLAMRGPFAVKPGDHSLEDEPAAGASDAGAQRLFDPPGAPQRQFAPSAHAQAADTDARLRAALSTLQRMRGAA